jgi:hypothetical protein
MALRTLPIAAELLGLVAAAQPEPLMRWDEKDGRRVLTDHQEKDENSGEPLWTAYVMPTGQDRPEVISVRVPARQQPVLTQFGPVAVDNLEAAVRAGKDGRLAQYWSASSIRDAAPNGHRPKPEHKPEGQG